MWPTTSRVVQPAQAVGRSQAPGSSASANSRWASCLTTRRVVSLPSYVIAFHSLMPYRTLLSQGRVATLRLGSPATLLPQIVAQRTCLHTTPQARSRVNGRDPGRSLLVQVATGEVHQLVAEQLDADAVRIAQVERLGNAAGRPVVRDAVVVEHLAQLGVPVRGHRDRDVLHGPDRLDTLLQAEAREVEEAEQGLVAEVEEEVRRARVVPVLHQLDEREAEQALVELDRPLDVAADQRGVVDPPPGRRRALRGRQQILPAQLGTALLDLDELFLGGPGHHRPFARGHLLCEASTRTPRRASPAREPAGPAAEPVALMGPSRRGAVIHPATTASGHGGRDVEVRRARGPRPPPYPAPMSEPAGRGWRRWVPIAEWLPRYDSGWLRGDLVAGAVVVALAVPQALGYASIAGAPVQVGLYAVPLALVAYAVFGSSRQLVVGPVSTVSVLSGSFLASFGVAGTARAASYTAALALACGLVMLVAGFLGIGWVAEFLSKPIVTGFVLGLVVLVILGELPHLLGVPTPQGRVVERVSALGGSLGRGDADSTTVLISAVALLILFGGQWLARAVPWALLVLVAGLAVSTALDLGAHGVEVVGPVPRGLPAPAVPSVAAADVPALLSSGAALALVGLAEGLSAARLFAARGGYRIDADQELRATGAANVASGLFGGLGVAGSLSKTAAVADARGRTQIAGLTAAALAVVVIALIAPVLSELPKAVLSAIVVNAVWKLMDVTAIRRYARVRQNDVVAATVAAVGVLAFGPLYGLLLAVAGSVLGLVYRSSRVDVEVMGKVPHEKAAWGSTRNHEERPTIPGVLVLRVDAPIFWVTAAPIHDVVLAEVEAAPGTRVVVLDMEATNQMDTTSADALADLLAELRGRGVDLYLVRVMWPVRQGLRRSGLVADLGEDHLWHSISQGVREARRTHGLKQLSARDGAADAEVVASEELLDEEVMEEEEHIAARSPAPVPGSGTGMAPPSEPLEP